MAKKTKFEIPPERACSYLGKKVYKVVEGHRNVLLERRCPDCAHITRLYEKSFEIVRAILDNVSFYKDCMSLSEWIRDEDPTYDHRHGELYLTKKEAQQGLAKAMQEELERRERENPPGAKRVKAYTKTRALRLLKRKSMEVA